MPSFHNWSEYKTQSLVLAPMIDIPYCKHLFEFDFTFKKRGHKQV